MISYLTEIDIKNKEIRTIWRGKTYTFACDQTRGLSLEKALELSAEFMGNQLKEWLADLLEHAEKFK